LTLLAATLIRWRRQAYHEIVFHDSVARPRLDNPPNYQVRALRRGLAILTSFSDSDGPQGLADISRRLDIPKATVLRLLECLRGEGFLSYDAANGRYALGLRAFEVGSSYLASSPLEQPALPFLRRAMENTDQTANLGVLDGHHVLHLAAVEPERPLRYHTRVGARELLHCTALGKVLAAERLDDAWLQELMAHVGLPRRTPATLTDPDAFRAELDQVRERGYAEDREEGTPGLRCLAAPVRATDGRVVAALSISGAAGEFDGSQREGLLQAVLESARGLSERLGWHD
jgi:DNA-binding IclR family transcriptional regulator